MTIVAALFGATLGVAGCGEGGEGGDEHDSSTDAAADDAAADLCSVHPGTCNLDGRNPGAPFDCCPAGRTCCALCADPAMCQLDYECRASCPETLPCSGMSGNGGFACYYDPVDFPATTVYCPVPDPLPSTGTVECTDSCTTGVTCPFDAGSWGDAALCCPAGASCATTAFGLPDCQ